MEPEAFSFPGAGWAVYKCKMVKDHGYDVPASELEKVESEEPFSLRENCQKRVDELNRLQPDDQCYLCGREDLRSPIRFSARFRDS